MVNLQRLITNGEWLGKRVEEEINLESLVKCPSEPPPLSLIHAQRKIGFGR